MRFFLFDHFSFHSAFRAGQGSKVRLIERLADEGGRVPNDVLLVSVPLWLSAPLPPGGQRERG